MQEVTQRASDNRLLPKLSFLFLFLMLLTDRAITLIHFGFIYTDVDQLVLWNGAVDYSRGIFHEPFFYGQPYNYMLESFIAVPLLYLNIPVYKALPLATTFISLLPFIALAILFYRRENYFWASICLAVPILLPLEYNFLTTISRGFVQAHLFIPFLFVPLLAPERKRNVTLLFIASAISFIANPSSVLLIIPIVVYVSSFHYKSTSLYIKALLVIPFFLLDFLFKYFYKIHPERVLHNISGVRLDGQTFIDSLNNTHLFENLFPFTPHGGFLYPLVLIILAKIAFRKAMKRELLFILSIIFILLLSFAIPKVQGSYPIENAGIFFSVSRFYLLLPLSVIISFYLIFREYAIKSFLVYSLPVFCTGLILVKNIPIQETVNKTVERTSFPVVKTQDLLLRANNLKELSLEHDIDLIVHKMSPSWDWNNLYDSYAFYPLMYNEIPQQDKIISVNLTGDRRTWLYESREIFKRILLVGFSTDEIKPDAGEHDIIGNDYILIKNNKLPTDSLFEKPDIKFGNLGLEG